MRHLQITPLIGLPQLSGWSQVVISPEQRLIAALAISGPNAGNVGRDVIETLLTTEVESTAEFHSLLLDLVQHIRSQECALHVAARLQLGDRAVFAAMNGWVLLKRDTKIGQLLTSTAELKIIEGRPQPQDQIVLATVQARDISGEIEQKLNQGFEIDSIITGLVPRVHEQGDSSLTALAFVAPGGEVTEPEPLLELELNVQAPPEPTHAASVIPTPVVAVSAGEPTPVVPTESLLSISELSELATTPAPETVAAPLEGESPDTENAPPDLTKRDFATQHLEARPSLAHDMSHQMGKVLQEKSVQVRGGLARGARQIGRAVLLLKDRILSRDQYLTKPSPRRLLRVIVPVCVVIVLGGGWLLFSRAQAQRETAAVSQELQPFRLQVAAAQSRAQREPVAARAELETILAELDRVKSERAKNSNAVKAIDAEIAAARAVYEEISGQEEFQALPLYFDLRSVIPGFITNLSDVDVTGNQAVFLDTEQKQFIILNTQSKEATTRAVPELTPPQSLSRLSGEEAVVTLGGGIKKTTLGDQPQTTELKPEGDSNREAKLLDTFGEYIYVFNPAKNNIYRYAPSDDGYSDPIGWLRSAPNLVFNDVLSMQIDGDLWLGTRQGGILKFASGRPADFTITGLAQPFNSPVMLATDEETTNLYVLEAGQQRVVVLSKTGEFIKEIKSASLASATQIIALEKQNKVLVVSGSLVFEVGL